MVAAPMARMLDADSHSARTQFFSVVICDTIWACAAQTVVGQRSLQQLHFVPGRPLELLTHSQ
jgi:hypothetical protein